VQTVWDPESEQKPEGHMKLVYSKTNQSISGRDSAPYSIFEGSQKAESLFFT